MLANPHDPRLRKDLTRNEQVVLQFTGECLHGDNLALIDTLVSPDYIQHTPGIGQGRDGLKNYLRAIAWQRPGRHEWRPIHLLASGNLVALHKLLPAVVIADFFLFDEQGLLAEHWDVVQTLPEPGYDPMRLSTENFTRFRALFNMG